MFSTTMWLSFHAIAGIRGVHLLSLFFRDLASSCRVFGEYLLNRDDGLAMAYSPTVLEMIMSAGRGARPAREEEEKDVDTEKKPPNKCIVFILRLVMKFQSMTKL